MQRLRSILVTGATGSFGKAFVRHVLKEIPDARVVVYSRDELKQHEMARLPEYSGAKVRFFIGDVRDKDRLRRAMEDVDTVVHAAAMKQVVTAEYNPFEVIKTNILGAQNVIECALDQRVNRVVALSTDKAASPINLYGATKLCSDKLFVAANNFRGARDLKVSVVRYGNVLGSRGSVVPLFLEERKKGVLPITDPEMTRFHMTLADASRFVMFALDRMWGGELFVPKIPSYRILDMARAIGPKCEHRVVGIRPGEKLHEELITASDALSAAEYDDHYVVFPTFLTWWKPDDYLKARGGTRLARGFSYESSRNTSWLSVEEIRRFIREHVDPNFSHEP